SPEPRQTVRVAVVSAPKTPSAPDRPRADEPVAGTETDDTVTASVREVAELREALLLREQQLVELRDELLHKERELELLRARERRSFVRSRRRSITPAPDADGFSELDEPSSLGSACSRFLVEAVERTLDGGWRTPSQFAAHFRPIDIMDDLGRHPAVRAA